MMGRIFAVARIELLRLLRMRIAFTLLVLVPALQVILFGTAIRPQGAEVRVAIAAPTPANADTIAKRLAQTPGVVIAISRLAPGDAEKAVREGKASIGVEIPSLRSFANPIAVQQPVRIVVDATNATLAANATARLEVDYWREIAERADATGPGIKVERLYNPDARADWTFLPALTGVTVMISMIMLGALSLAREREGGTWEALLALPIRPVEALLGKLAPYALVGSAQGVLVLAIAVSAFDLPMRGSVAALLLLFPLFALAHLALGYAIAARASTQLSALQGAVAFYLPAMLLSGFLYPFETLPRWAQFVGNLFPLTHFIRAAQGALLRGDSATIILVQAIPIALFLAAALAIAALLQARRFD